MATDGLTAAADALYALVPEEFTAARNARAADAKASDRALAKRISSLKRPSPAAWVVNRLAREHGEEVGDLVGLGGELADAQASGDGRALTALVGERRRAVANLLGLASAVADAADRSLSRAVLDEVEQTLVAATVSAAAGAAVQSGRLVRGLQAVGSEVDVSEAVAGEAPAAAPAPSRRAGARSAPRTKPQEVPAPPSDSGEGVEADDGAARRAAAIERAREAADEAHALAGEARRARESAEADSASASRRVEELRAERDELEARLDALRDELAEAEREARSATRAHEAAVHASDLAEADADAADEELRRLG